MAISRAYPDSWFRSSQEAKYMGREYALERPVTISISQAINAFPLLVRPFIWVNSTNQAVWLHRQREAPTPAKGESQAVAL